jgi:16S rRNA (uracil1498-N3)-methyltransferase
MVLPFFYHPQLAAESKNLQLDEATSKHIVQVLRMKEGEQIHLTNGKGLLAICEINSVSKKSCLVTIIKDDFTAHPGKRKTAIAISPVKNASRFEWFLEKATELGVSEIFPTVCTRTEREHFRYDRMNNICISAMLQSQQAWLPHLHQPTPFNVVATNNNYHNKWIAHCIEQQRFELASSIAPNMQDALIFIGPEGDFTIEEIEKAISNNFKPVLLGQTRLRTETAGMVAAALLMLA